MPRKPKKKEDPWKDDLAFRALSENKGLTLKRLSWHCANFLCGECDGKIHYHLKKFKTQTISATTGKTTTEWEECNWDTDFESVQLTDGSTQNKQNTPEGSRCECMLCHGRPGYDEWKAEQEKLGPSQTRGRMKIVRREELSDEERKLLT